MTIHFPENSIADGTPVSSEGFVRQLYDLYYRPLCYFANRLIEDKQAAEDIAIENFVKILQRKDFTGQDNIKSYLFLSVRNACIDYLRKKKVEDKYTLELSYLLKAAESFGDEEMLKAKVLQVIYAEMEALPPQCRSVFKSIFIEGKTTGTIAGEMGISKQTVLNQKTNALLILREKLHGQGLYTIAFFLTAFFATP